MVIAWERAAATAVITAGAVFFASLQAGAPLKVAGIAAGASFFATLAVRGAAEGVIDTVAASPAAAPTRPPTPPTMGVG